MVQQADSIQTEAALEAESQPQVLRQHSSQPTPKEVLSWLPKNATPAQQDSMIRAHIKPSEIHWSEMPDTLHLPGHEAGKSFRDVSLPQYYRESFFSKDSLFHPVAGDSFITSLLLVCFLLACIAFSKSKHFVIRQAKTFFRTPRIGTTEVTETSSEVRYQFFFVLQTCLLLAIGYFIYSKASISDTFIVDQYQVISIYAGCMGGYFLLKTFLYMVSGWVFFEKKKNIQWLKAYLFLISCQGVLLFPMVMLLSYFDFPLQIAVIYTLIVLGLVKILAFLKAYIIFFRRNGVFLQIFLYFCALEVVPLFALWGGLVLISHYLKINF